MAVIFALASALTIAWGTVVRHRIASRVPAGQSPILQAIRRPLWWAGMSTAIIAYILQVVALSFGPLLIVQPILVTSLIFTLLASAAQDRKRISAGELSWAIVLTSSVTIVILLGRPVGSADHPSFARWAPALLIGAVVLAAMTRWSARLPGPDRAFVLGLVTGAVFGFVAVLSKAVADTFTAGGLLGLAVNWETYALILAATFGTLIQQNAFNASALSTSLPAMKAGEPVVAFTLGFLVLGETFRASGWNWVWLALALLAMITATVMLSRKGAV